MVVVVHNSSLRPREVDGVYVKPGESSYIGVKRTFVNNVPSPYTDCHDLTTYSSELYDFIVSSNRTYRQKNCFELCTQQLIMEECGCYYTGYDIAYFDSNLIRPCLTLTDSTCFNNAFYEIDVIKCASESCPLECETIQYDLTVSSLIKPTINDYNALPRKVSSLSYEEWRTKSVKINVFYSQLEYTLIEETPAMTFASLVASIGGKMDLLVSVSFFTLLEVIELFFLLLHASFNSKKTLNDFWLNK